MQRVDVDVGDDDEVVCLALVVLLPSCIARFCFVMLLVALLLCSTLHCFPSPFFCYLIRGHAPAGLRVRRDSMSPTVAFLNKPTLRCWFFSLNLVLLLGRCLVATTTASDGVSDKALRQHVQGYEEAKHHKVGSKAAVEWHNGDG